MENEQNRLEDDLKQLLQSVSIDVGRAALLPVVDALKQQQQAEIKSLSASLQRMESLCRESQHSQQAHHLSHQEHLLQLEQKLKHHTSTYEQTQHLLESTFQQWVESVQRKQTEIAKQIQESTQQMQNLSQRLLRWGIALFCAQMVFFVILFFRNR